MLESVMEIKTALEKVGLNTHEIEIYLYLLKNGATLAPKIISETQIEKSRVYKSLTSLQTKNFVISIGDSRNQIFKVSGRDEVERLFNNQVEKINNSKELVLNTYGKLEDLMKSSYLTDNIMVYTGDNAYTDYHVEMLKTQNLKQIRTIVSSNTEHNMAGSKEKVKEVNNWFIPQRTAKGISVQVLYDKESTPDEYDVSDPSLLKECRRYMGKLELQSGMSILGSRVGFNSIRNGTYWAIIINDAQITSLLNSMYEAIWHDSIIVNK